MRGSVGPSGRGRPNRRRKTAPRAPNGGGARASPATRAASVSARGASATSTPSVRVRRSAHCASPRMACRRAIAARSPGAPTPTTRGERSVYASSSRAHPRRTHQGARSSARAHADREGYRGLTQDEQDGGRRQVEVTTNVATTTFVFDCDVRTTLISAAQSPKTVTGLFRVWRVLARD
jgi:hypothetical protein